MGKNIEIKAYASDFVAQGNIARSLADADPESSTSMMFSLSSLAGV